MGVRDMYLAIYRHDHNLSAAEPLQPIESERSTISLVVINRVTFILHILLYLSLSHASARLLAGNNLPTRYLSRTIKPSRTRSIFSSSLIYFSMDLLP